MAQLIVWLGSVMVAAGDRPPLALLISGAVLSTHGAAVVLGRRWAYPGILVTAVVAVVAGIALMAGEQGVPPGTAGVGIPTVAFGFLTLAMAVTPRSIRWAKGDASSCADPRA